MQRKNKKLDSFLAFARDGLKSLRPDHSLRSLWSEAQKEAKRLNREARRQAKRVGSEATKRFAVAKREGSERVAAFQARLVGAIGIATKPQLEELDHRIARLAKKLDLVLEKSAAH